MIIQYLLKAVSQHVYICAKPIWCLVEMNSHSELLLGKAYLLAAPTNNATKGNLPSKESLPSFFRKWLSVQNSQHFILLLCVFVSFRTYRFGLFVILTLYSASVYSSSLPLYKNKGSQLCANRSLNLLKYVLGFAMWVRDSQWSETPPYSPKWAWSGFVLIIFCLCRREAQSERQQMADTAPQSMSVEEYWDSESPSGAFGWCSGSWQKLADPSSHCCR